MKKNEMIMTDYRGIVKQDANALQVVFEAIQNVEKDLSKACDAWGVLSEKTRQVVIEKCKGNYTELFKRLDMVSKNQLEPTLFFSTGAAVKKIAKLPLKDQRRVISSGVPVVVKEGRKFVTKVKKWEDLDRNETKIAFNDGELASVTEQVIKIKSKGKPDIDRLESTYKLKRAGKYTVEGDRVYFDTARNKLGITKSILESALKDLSR